MTIPEHLPLYIGATAYGLVFVIGCSYAYIVATPEKKDNFFRKGFKRLFGTPKED